MNRYFFSTIFVFIFLNTGLSKASCWDAYKDDSSALEEEMQAYNRDLFGIDLVGASVSPLSTSSDDSASVASSASDGLSFSFSSIDKAPASAALPSVAHLVTAVSKQKKGNNACKGSRRSAEGKKKNRDQSEKARIKKDILSKYDSYPELVTVAVNNEGLCLAVVSACFTVRGKLRAEKGYVGPSQLRSAGVNNIFFGKVEQYLKRYSFNENKFIKQLSSIEAATYKYFPEAEPVASSSSFWPVTPKRRTKNQKSAERSRAEKQKKIDAALKLLSKNKTQ